MTDIKNHVEAYINDMVLNNGNVTKYRKPLIGYADANDNLFKYLPEVTFDGHLMPKDLLQEAKTVIAFFLPFAKEVIKANRKPEVSTEWAVAYNETNALLYEISKGLKKLLNDHGYKANFVEPTNNFDKVMLVSPWSHKHISYVAGLGKFGLNRLLITPVGSAGRFSSVVTNLEIETKAVANQDYQHRMCEQCGWCLRNICPVSALTTYTWDKHSCWEKLKENEKTVGLHMAHSCGKCTIGPCAILE